MVWFLVLAWCSGTIQGVDVCSTTVIPQWYSQMSNCRSDGQKAVKSGFASYRCVAKTDEK